MKKINIIRNLQPTTYNLQPNLGITLIELIVVMMIIAIIAGALWGNFFSSLNKGRDSRRKQDLEAVARSVELYYNDMSAYPTALPSWGAPFTNPDSTSVVYIQALPVDPATGSNYCYNSDGTYYQIYANLENANDIAVFTTPVACNSTYYNYGISSPNVTPGE